MKIYSVSVKKGYNDHKELTVVARSPKAVIEIVEKYAKKNFYYTWEILKIEYNGSVDAFQK